MSSEYMDLSAVSIIYRGEFLSCVPKTYKAFLESLRDKEGITNEEFCKRTIWLGDFPILTKADYLILLKSKGLEGIFEVDLVKNEDEEDENLFGDKDYKQFYLDFDTAVKADKANGLSTVFPTSGENFYIIFG